MEKVNRIIARFAPLVILGLFAFFAVDGARADNLHLIEELPNGFAIYRSGSPSKDDVVEYGELGIQEMAVLAGNADKHELKYRDQHPDLKIVYNDKQNASVPLDDEFLDWFDAWVEEARAEGKKIAFRCNCGCHRAGRLAAYYQMKWQNLSYEDATIIMEEHGKHMWNYRYLWDQVEMLAKRIETQRTEKQKLFAPEPEVR
jgi:protein-tyrosine phosphatase